MFKLLYINEYYHMADNDDKETEIKEKERVIRQVYYDVDTGYSSIQQTYEDSKKILNKITDQIITIKTLTKSLNLTALFCFIRNLV
mgnify:CR=1 FL=1